MTTSSTLILEFRQLAELVKLVCDVEAYCFGKGWRMCWFRGSNTAYPLVPGQYRLSYKRLHEEESTFLEFKQQARGFLHKELNDWEIYFLMQHYRVPTRLLDWTENCLVALYFALTDTANPKGDPCIWMLNPLLFNKHNSPTHDSSIVVIPNSINPDRKYWINAFHPLHFDVKHTEFKDSEGQTAKIVAPVAICPPTVDPRIVAQRSVFTLHGQCCDSIDKCCEGHPEPKEDFIHQFIFKGIRREVLRELRWFGITRQAVFPDLEGLGMELRHRLTMEEKKWDGR